ncbi:MAG: hypothetical protein O3A01_05910 [bacterium]|nr:hypothetical protein [bacterium]
MNNGVNVFLNPKAGSVRTAFGMEIGKAPNLTFENKGAMVERISSSGVLIDVGASCIKITSQAGERPLAPDGLPIAGAHPLFSNAFVLNGLGTSGASSLVLSEQVVAQAAGKAPEFAPHASFSPSRFA